MLRFTFWQVLGFAGAFRFLFPVFIEVVEADVDQIEGAGGLSLPDVGEEADEEERSEAQHDSADETIEECLGAQVWRKRPYHDSEHEGVVGTEQPFHGDEHKKDGDVLDPESGVHSAER